MINLTYCSILLFVCVYGIDGQANETYKACKSVITCFNDAENEMDRCLGILIGDKPAPLGSNNDLQRQKSNQLPPPIDSDDCMTSIKDKIRQKKLLDRGKIQEFQGCLAQRIDNGAEDVDPRKYRYCATVTGRYLNKTAEINSKRYKRQASLRSTERRRSKQALSTTLASAPTSEASLSTSEAPSFKLGSGSGSEPTVSSIASDSPASLALSTEAPSSDSTIELSSLAGFSFSPLANIDSSSQSSAYASSTQFSVVAEQLSSSTKATILKKEENDTLPVLAKQVDAVSGQAFSVSISENGSDSSLPTETHSSTPSSSNGPSGSTKASVVKVDGLKKSAEQVQKSGDVKKASSEKPSSKNVDPSQNQSTSQKPALGGSKQAEIAQIPIALENIESQPQSRDNLQQQNGGVKNRVEILREARRRLSEFKGCMARARIKREECKPLVRCCPDAASCYLNYETSDQHNKVHKLDKEIVLGRQECLHKKRLLNKDELTDALDQIDAEELISDDSVVSQIIF